MASGCVASYDTENWESVVSNLATPAVVIITMPTWSSLAEIIIMAIAGVACDDVGIDGDPGFQRV